MSQKRKRVIVVTESADSIAGRPTTSADAYLAGADGADDPQATVVNLARCDRYLSEGWYVSLLADARGQLVLPTVDTLEAISNVPEALRLLEDAGIETFHGSGVDRRRTLSRLAALDRPEIVETVAVLGRPARPELGRLCAKIHARLPLPACRLSFARVDGTLRLFHIEAVPFGKLDATQRDVLAKAVATQRWGMGPESKPIAARVSLAILFDPDDPFKPSWAATLDHFAKIAARMGVRVQRIGPRDIERVAEHDALFIRTLTGPDLPAFRFAQRAESLGMPVIDSTHSILRCGNKVYLAELLQRTGLPTPRTTVVVRGSTYEQTAAQIGTPFVLKVPDGSFCTAVFKIASKEVWDRSVPDLLAGSPLLLAQAWTPSPFDWRIGVLDGRPLYGCRYWMVPGHWQVRRVAQDAAPARDGRVESVPLEQVPAAVRRVACRAARLIGDGLYGVDVKEIGSGAVVIEVNDNPDVHVDYEDRAEGDRVYEELVSWFVSRVDGERKAPASPSDPSPPSQPPIGRPPRHRRGRDYRAWEVVGLEVEYGLVDAELEPLHAAEAALGALAGRSTSEVDLGAVSFSNEFFDHLVELKTQPPLESLIETERVLAEGVSRLASTLEDKLGARAFPTSMHPWLDPRTAQRWTRSGRAVYETYARLFPTDTHGWANVQSLQVNLPLGREHEAVAMMNAAALLVPYLPAVAASSPMFDGALGPAADNRLAFILGHQLRIPESQGALVPEYIESLAGYRRDIIRPIYAAVDRLEDAGAIRHEWLNARGAVFKMARRSMEVRVIDSQECPRMDVAIAAYVRGALHDLAGDLVRGRLPLPDHSALVRDLEACVKDGSQAKVLAPFVPGVTRDDDGRAAVADVTAHFLTRAARRLRRGEQEYLALVDAIRTRGTLSERIRARLGGLEGGELRDATKKVYGELCACLIANQPWSGR